MLAVLMVADVVDNWDSSSVVRRVVNLAAHWDVGLVGLLVADLVHRKSD